MRHKLCRQRWVPSHWFQTKLDTSVHWCSKHQHSIIMTARQLKGCTDFFSLHPSICWESWGQRSLSSLWSECATLVYVYVCMWIKRDWVWDSCRLSHSYQSPFNVRPLRALWRQLRTNYSTGRCTDEFCRRERWLSGCVKSVCACSCVFVESLRMCATEKLRHEGWMPPWHLSRSSVYLFVCMCVHECAQSKRNDPQSHLAAMPHDEYTAKSVILTLITIPACPDVQLWQGEWVCACVRACTCVSSEQRQHHLSGPVTVCVFVQDAKAAGTQRCKPRLAGWLSRLTVYYSNTSTASVRYLVMHMRL